MEHMNNAEFEQLCAQLQQAGIAKVSFQSYWFSDEDTIDEIRFFDANEQEVTYPKMFSLSENLWELTRQEKEHFGRFEFYLPQKHLVRLGAARLATLTSEDEEWFVGGRDDEAIEHIYTSLQTAGIHTLTLQSYRHWELHEIVNVHGFNEHGQEVALPEGLSASDLRVIVREGPESFGRLKLLVNERRCIFLGALNAQEFNLSDEYFDGGEDRERDT